MHISIGINNAAFGERLILNSDGSTIIRLTIHRELMEIVLLVKV